MSDSMRRFFKQFSPRSSVTGSGDKSLVASGRAPSAKSSLESIIQNARHSPESPGAISTDSLGTSSNTGQERINGLTELISQPPDKSDAIDIIAIHGLDGHQERTWTDTKTRVNWLSDASCLPRDIPNARILTYGYNSTSYFSRADSDVRDFASALLAALRAKRKTNAEKQRPMIFICHSLGGLVFKQLVVRGHEQDSFYGPLIEKIRGVVFLATPHRGSDLAYWDSIGTRIVRAATLGMTTNSKIVKDLKVDSEMLKRISDSFAYRGAAFKIRSFYETEFMLGLNCCVVDKDSARLGWSNELDIASPANHSGICKFSSREDPRYETVVSEIVDMIEVEEDVVDLTPFTARDKSCMRQLNSEYTSHLDQIDDPVPQTCKWVLSHDKWKQWKACPGASLLWITLNAGCGKSVMAKFLVNYFQSGCDASTTKNLAYFFFMDGVTGQNDASAAVSALLHQLYCSQNRLIKHALTRFDGTPVHVFNSFSTLWAILVNSLDDTQRKDVIWILDGLDECESRSLRQFMDSIAALIKRPNTTKLKIILLSRPTNQIQHSLGLFIGADMPHDSCSNKFRLFGENECDALTADILHFAQWKIDDPALASTFPANVLTRLRERLVAGADYTFLWISLVMKMIEDSAKDGISESELGRILETKKIHDMYCHLLKGACSINPAKTRRLLAILLASVRPMTVDEMCAAVEIMEDDNTETTKTVMWQNQARIEAGVGRNVNFPQKWQRQSSSSQPQSKAQSLQTLGQRLHKPFDNHIRQLCGHFVRIRRGRIYFVHQTARSFLATATFTMDANSEDFEDKETWRPIKLDRAHHTLLRICVRYIRMMELEKDHRHILSANSTQIAKYLESCKKDPTKAFFLYAARHWIKHYQNLRELLRYRYDELLQPDTSIFKTWIIVHKSWLLEQESSDDTPGALETPDHIASVKYSRLEKAKLVVKFDQRFDVFEKWAVKHHRTHSDNKNLVQSLQAIAQTFTKLRRGFDSRINDDNWIMYRYKEDGVQGLVREIQTSYLNPMRQQLEELDRRRAWAFERNPGLEELLQQMQSEKDYEDKHKEVDQATMIYMQYEREVSLRKVLIHFRLLHLEEAGLEYNDFLREYFQKHNGSDIHRHLRTDSQENADNNEYDDRTDEDVEDGIPNWVKHYLHTEIEEAAKKDLLSKMGTPGVDLPELSSFKPRYLDQNMTPPTMEDESSNLSEGTV
ncbi:hypothetical protein J3E69DRAFT_364751 [Trichoderma sp. SZMC 28015]